MTEPDQQDQQDTELLPAPSQSRPGATYANPNEDEGTASGGPDDYDDVDDEYERD